MSDTANPSELAARCVEKALGQGATEVDAIVIERRAQSATVRLGEVESVESSRERRLGLRCFHGKASAVSATADLGESSLDPFVSSVLGMARLMVADPDSGLPDGAVLEHQFPDLDLADPVGLSIDNDDAIGLARECEAAALGFDPRIQNSSGATCSGQASHLGYASSAGFRGDYRTTHHSLSVAPVAAEDGVMQQGHWWDAARQKDHLAAPEEIGAKAAMRALRALGPRKISTQRAPVVFEAPVAGSLVGHLAAAVCGGALYRGVSFLRDRLGETIASSLVTIDDDGRIPNGPASCPFDAEGLPTRRSTIVAEGRLENYLLDTYAARRLGMSSTGSASRSVSSAPAAGPHNFHLRNGSSSPAELLRGMARGLLVTGLSGFSVNPTTGDYSRGASGLWIENGDIAFAVEEITIAGNLLEMYKAIDGVGNDLRTRSGIASPSLRVAEMTIAGS